MSNEKMREAFDKLLSKNEGQFSNTSFSIFKEGYQAALAQQSEPSKYSDLVSDGGMDMRDRLAQQSSKPVLVQGCHRSHPHENMQDACFDAWEKTMNDHIKSEPAQVSQELQQEVNAKETGLLISKVARLEAENEALKTRVAEYKASSEQDAKTLTKFHSDRERLRGKLFEAETDRDNALLERDKLRTGLILMTIDKKIRLNYTATDILLFVAETLEQAK